jgi:hypothetical protein
LAWLYTFIVSAIQEVELEDLGLKIAYAKALTAKQI